MNLEAIYFVSQVVAAAALIGSLIFVGIQVRQARKQAEVAERTARSQANQLIADSFLELHLEWPRRQEIYHLMMSSGAYDELTQKQRFDLGGMLLATMKVGENAYFQYVSGMLSREQLNRWLALSVTILGSSAARTWWEQRRTDFDDGFSEHIDELIADRPSFQNIDFYKADEPQTDVALPASPKQEAK